VYPISPPSSWPCCGGVLRSQEVSPGLGGEPGEEYGLIGEN